MTTVSFYSTSARFSLPFTTRSCRGHHTAMALLLTVLRTGEECLRLVFIGRAAEHSETLARQRHWRHHWDGITQRTCMFIVITGRLELYDGWQ